MNNINLATLAVIALAAQALAQRSERLPDLDFEEGLHGWHATGAAFAGQPVKGDSFSTNRTSAMRLGGDYWRDLQFPVGDHGKRFIFTLESEGGDQATGSLISDDITLSRERRYFSLLVGGTNDPLREHVELQVLANSPNEAIAPRDGDHLVLFRATGRGTDLLHQEVFSIPSFALGRKARIKIVDDSSVGHINADYIRFTSEPPAPYAAPAWGFADYHAHPMNYMAFGALNGISTLWGRPGGAYKDYLTEPCRINNDLPYCSKGHGGGPTAEAFINSVDNVQLKRPRNKLIIFESLLAGHFTSHGRYGAPSFQDFPSFLSGAHHQMHITQIHRAWEAGLRLMVAFAVHNRGVEYLVSLVKDGKICPSQERDVVEAQICGTRRLVNLNSDWMEIAYTPDDARRIIRENKLAIVLGIEVDRLGELGKGDAEHEIDYLWKLGIRHVFPIHAFNNRLGGPSVFEDAYNSTNDLLNRRDLNIEPKDINTDPSFFDVKEGCLGGPSDRGECVLYRLQNPVDRVVISRLLPDFLLDRILPAVVWKKIPFIRPVKIDAYEKIKYGEMNQLGLLPEGIAYVRTLIRKGMLIDLAHMSEQSVTDTYNVIGSLLKRQGLTACESLASKTKLPDVCYENAYPTTASHIHFRAQSLQPCQTTYEPFLPREYEMSNHQLELMQLVGGVLGPFVAEDPVDPPADQPPSLVKNDCAGSSKGFAYSFLYGLSKMGGKGVGLATDYTFIPSVAPRFGQNACWPYKRADNPDKERRLYPTQYRTEDQIDGVDYKDEVRPGVRVAKKEGITRYVMGEHGFDYNTEGLANYGLLPDFLQDLKNVGFPKEAMDELFSSSEYYIRMWEKAWRVSNISAGSAFAPSEPPDCDVACRGLCPERSRGCALVRK